MKVCSNCGAFNVESRTKCSNCARDPFPCLDVLQHVLKLNEQKVETLQIGDWHFQVIEDPYMPKNQIKLTDGSGNTIHVIVQEKE